MTVTKSGKTKYWTVKSTEFSESFLNFEQVIDFLKDILND